MSLGETARALGLGDRGGRHSPFLRTVNRMIQFELAQVAGPGRAGGAPTLAAAEPAADRPPVAGAPGRPRALAGRAAQGAAGEAQRRRGRQLALSLLELGEDVEEAERQLLRWRYHPALAREAATWAPSSTARLGPPPTAG